MTQQPEETPLSVGIDLASGPDVTGFSGSYTNAQGERVQMTPEEAEALWRQVEAERAAREVAMPDEAAALRVLCDAYHRLKELGWREAIYCPKDGSSFRVIEAGSTGIFRAHYYGEWPTGGWIIHDEEGGSPSRPILFRLDPEKEAEEKARFKAAVERFRAAAADEAAP